MNYQISQERLESLILGIISKMKLRGLYRVQFAMTKEDHFEASKNTLIVALFFDQLFGISEMSAIKDKVEQKLEDIMNVSVYVIPIPYNEEDKYHLKKERNIF